MLLSASQITTYRDECKRKWGLKSILKLPTPQHPSAALGTEVDDTQLQPYLRDGRPFDFTRPSGSGDIANSALRFLPEPKSHGLEVQKHFVMHTPTKGVDLQYQGYIDLWMPKGGLPLPDGLEPITTVCDFKTTGNWKYAKTAKQLETDVQATLYATWAMVSTGVRTVDLVWIYMGTKGARKAERRHLRVLGPRVQEEFLKINATGLEMHKTRTEIEAGDVESLVMQLPPNPAACDGFGGCPFRSKCNLSPSVFADASTAKALEEMENVDMSETVSLLAKLRAKRLEGAPAAGASPEIGMTPMPTNLGSPLPESKTEFVGINPPESKLPVSALAVSTPAVSEPLPAPVEAAPVAETSPAKRGPGRPRKTAPKDPVGADAAHYTGGAPGIEYVSNETASEMLAEQRPSRPLSEGVDLLESVSVTWGKEKVQPLAYNDFEVGPFEATGFVRAGETIGQAQARIYAELEAFAEGARERKAASFAKALASGGGK